MLDFQQEARIRPGRIQKPVTAEEFRLTGFEDMNLALEGNDHSFQQKRNARKFLKATAAERNFSLSSRENSSIVNTRTFSSAKRENTQVCCIASIVPCGFPHSFSLNC
jgi:hypothetical protein